MGTDQDQFGGQIGIRSGQHPNDIPAEGQAKAGPKRELVTFLMPPGNQPAGLKLAFDIEARGSGTESVRRTPFKSGLG